jgi:hypothetical protein
LLLLLLLFLTLFLTLALLKAFEQNQLCCGLSTSHTALAEKIDMEANMSSTLYLPQIARIWHPCFAIADCRRALSCLSFGIRCTANILSGEPGKK